MSALYSIFNKHSYIWSMSIERLMLSQTTSNLSLAEIFDVEPEQYQNVPIYQAGFLPHLENALKCHGLRTLTDLLRYTINDLLLVRNIGKVTIKQGLYQLRSFLFEYTFDASSSSHHKITQKLYNIMIGKLNGSFYTGPLSEQEEQTINTYQNALNILGWKLCSEAFQKSNYLLEIRKALSRFYIPITKCCDYKAEITNAVTRLPETLKSKPVRPFIQAYYKTLSRAQCNYLLRINNGISIRKFIYSLCIDDLQDALAPGVIADFVKWLDFDTDLIIHQTNNLLSNLNKRSKDILHLRKHHTTMSVIGQTYSISAQRVGGIIRASYRTIRETYKKCTYDVIAFVRALKDGKDTITLSDMECLIGKEAAKTLWDIVCIKELDCGFYSYSKDIDAVVFTCTDANKEYP